MKLLLPKTIEKLNGKDLSDTWHKSTHNYVKDQASLENLQKLRQKQIEIR